ncbi:MAG: HypC/HybG/HupF family hydrogenase formation chaperone [Acidobacteriota bacterium]
MCLAVPCLLRDVGEDAGLRVGRVELGGVSRRVCLDLVPEARPGDYLLIHVGFAIARLDEAEALRTIALLDAGAAASELRGPVT